MLLRKGGVTELVRGLGSLQVSVHNDGREPGAPGKKAKKEGRVGHGSGD